VFFVSFLHPSTQTLAYETIVANSRFFGGDISKVPTRAVTVGVGTVMDAEEVSPSLLLYKVESLFAFFFSKKKKGDHNSDRTEQECGIEQSA